MAVCGGSVYPNTENNVMNDRVAFVVYLPAKEGRLEEMQKHLLPMIHTMAAEPDFINAWVHVSQDDPNTVVVYETWACTREHFIQHHFPKPYRLTYEALLPDFLASARRIDFLDVLASYPERRVA